MALLAMFGLCVFIYANRNEEQDSEHTGFHVLAVVVYVTAGKACLLFAVLCAMHEFVVRRRWLNGVMCLAAALVISYIGNILFFDASIVESLQPVSPFPCRYRPWDADNYLHILPVSSRPR